MKIIVGLGNPGPKYSRTRHNCGFRVLEVMAGRHSIEKEESKYDAIIAHLKIGSEKLLLVKPLTYMNHSGRPVQRLVNWYKIELSELMVIYDDMDIEPGVLRIRALGGAGGHKGVGSIIECLGNNKEFPRIRIGIGRPPEGAMDWVLGEFKPEEKPLVQDAVQKAAEAAELWVKEGITRAMNAYN
ncbi:MAG: aminoacyl-tRNA hydrolase [Syntrophomonadaceae bacterium]|nr:aminoacyl-tRNA hydrolase [Syntrophomonadaceae bacterium]